MSNAVEYNKIAIGDVKSILTQLLATENTEISINSVNMGNTRDKIEEYFKLYNALENDIRTIIQQTEKMLDNVISAVDEVDGN